MKRVSIGDICSFAKGSSIPRARMLESGDYLYLHYGDLYRGHNLYIDIADPDKEIPFIQHIEKIRNDQFVDDGDIIYVLTSETVEDLGKALMLRNTEHEPVVAGTETTIMRITDRTVVDPRWLNYLLHTDRFKKTLRQYVTGMKVFRVHPRDISKIEIDLPSLDTQQRIADILDTIYSAIRCDAKQNDYLGELASTIYCKTLEGLLACDTLLSDVATVKYGKGLATKNLTKEGYPVFGGNGQIGFYSSYLFEDPQILISCRGAASGNIMTSLPKSYVTSNSLVVELKDRRYYEWLKQHFLANQLHGLATGSAQPQITVDSLKFLTVPYPEYSAIASVDAQLKCISDYSYSLSIENAKLEELRDSLLPRLMSGEIDVSKVDLTQLNNHLSYY